MSLTRAKVEAAAALLRTDVRQLRCAAKLAARVVEALPPGYAIVPGTLFFTVPEGGQRAASHRDDTYRLELFAEWTTPLCPHPMLVTGGSYSTATELLRHGIDLSINIGPLGTVDETLLVDRAN